MDSSNGPAPDAAGVPICELSPWARFPKKEGLALTARAGDLLVRTGDLRVLAAARSVYDATL